MGNCWDRRVKNRSISILGLWIVRRHLSRWNRLKTDMHKRTTNHTPAVARPATPPSDATAFFRSMKLVPRPGNNSKRIWLIRCPWVSGKHRLLGSVGSRRQVWVPPFREIREMNWKANFCQSQVLCKARVRACIRRWVWRRHIRFWKRFKVAISCHKWLNPPTTKIPN